jgi:hypothetical protein
MGKNLSNNSLIRYGEATITVWPIIGKPEIIGITKKQLKPQDLIELDIIVLALPNRSIEDIQQELADHLSLIPLLGLNPTSKKANQGKTHPLRIERIRAYPIVNHLDPVYWEYFLSRQDSKEKYCTYTGIEPLPNHLVLADIYPGHKSPFIVTVSLELNDEIVNYLTQNRFLLFNLIQTFLEDPELVRDLPHAVCLSTNDQWDNLQYLHISDLHIAKRYDDLIGIIQTNMKKSIVKSVVNFYEENIQKKLFPGREKPGLWDLPLEQRYTNPNNMLRRFIRYANHQAMQNNVDFIVMTGDLIDYCLKTEASMSILDYDYPNTNWTHFLDILLHRPIEPREGYELVGIEPSEELLVPFFTTLGNHDYRATHYTIQALGVYKKLRLKASESINYSDASPPLAPLLATKSALQGYYQHLNPYHDFFLKFGKHTLVFLDSGPDSAKEIKYLLMADPSLIGFDNDQLFYLEQLGQKIFSNPDSGYNFIFSHAPILNPELKSGFQVSLRQKLGLVPQFNIHDFQESRLKSIGIEDPRADEDLNFRAGTIAENWSKMLDYTTRYKSITLNGHTHKCREFRTIHGTTPSVAITGYGKKEIHPFAIYWDNYSDLYKHDPEKFTTLRPLHFQTPSLGIGHDGDQLEPGAFRRIDIEKDKISNLSVDYLGDARFPEYLGLSNE